MIDISCRCFWILPYIPQITATSKLFWFQNLTSQIDVLQFLNWMVVRLENQQATNAEDYSEAKFIPKPLSEYEKESNLKKADEKEQEEEMDGLKKMLQIF